MQIAAEKVVTIHYTLSDPGGEILDSSVGREPMAYLHGANAIIPGLETALEGKMAGDKLNVTVDPDGGYGPVNDALIQTASREAFQGIDKIEPGMRFRAESSQGPVTVTVTRVETDSVTVDGNHPLAGMTLNFDVQVVEVRNATAEELSHGHVHGPAGHGH